MRILIVLVFGFYIGTAGAAFQIENQFSLTNLNTGLTEFSITFTEIPDLITVDNYGRHANGFQYYIYGDLNQPYTHNFASIIRGEEINVIDNLIPVRNPSKDSLPGCQETGSGGWGCISFEIPYTITDRTLTFSALTNDLTMFPNANGSITYDILLVEYGATSDSLNGVISQVPLPASCWLFLSPIIGLFGLKLRYKELRQRTAKVAA